MSFWRRRRILVCVVLVVEFELIDELVGLVEEDFVVVFERGGEREQGVVVHWWLMYRQMCRR